MRLEYEHLAQLAAEIMEEEALVLSQMAPIPPETVLVNTARQFRTWWDNASPEQRTEKMREHTEAGGSVQEILDMLKSRSGARRTLTDEDN